VTLLLFLLAGQPSPPPGGAPGSELTVTLVTYGTGPAVWERFGHNAIWIHDAASGQNAHYDYGRFDFDQRNFLLRFIQGRMWYSMGFEADVERMLAAYAGQGRRVVLQELDLPPEARRRMRDFLEWNIRPENAGYAYDYYRDNCSTRIRDVLDEAAGGAIRAYGGAPSGFTWRDETRRLNEHNAALYTGLLVMLGQPVDREMTRWEQMFLPERLSAHLDSIRIAEPGGATRPLVRSSRVLAPGGSWPVPDRPTDWTWRYLLAGIVAGTLMALAGRTAALLPLATLWLLLCGLAGSFMTWVWAGSNHVTSYRNENLFLFNFLALALAVLLPAALRGSARWRGPARVLAIGVGGVAVLGLFVKLLPGFPQHNLEILALVLPLHLAVVLGVLRRLGPAGPTR
jgi:hypothetical protein